MNSFAGAKAPESIDVVATFDHKYRIIFLNGQRVYARDLIQKEYREKLEERSLEIGKLILLFEGEYARAKLDFGRAGASGDAYKLFDGPLETILELQYLSKLAHRKIGRARHAEGCI